MKDEELAALRASHQYVKAIRRNGEIVAVFRNVKFDELAPIHKSTRNPALNEKALADACLLWPDRDAWKALVEESPAVVQYAVAGIREISGEQCEAEFDEESHTWTAFVKVGEERRKILVVGKLGWPQYQKMRADMQGDKLPARRSACVDAGTFPENRDARKAVFDDLPYLAESMFTLVFALSGGGDFDFESN